MGERLQATLLLLAGGASRRMGRPKALLPVGEVTLIEHVAARLEGEFAEVLVSANDPALVPPRLAARVRVVRDLHRHAGPLAGIEAGLAAAAHEVLVAVACDMPHVTPALARRLAEECAGRDAAVPVTGGRAEPVCAAYAQTSAAVIAAALGAGRHRPREALDELDVAWLRDVGPEELRSLNSPEDYRAFLDALR